MAPLPESSDARTYVESWATSYGSPYAIEEEETASGEVALVEGEFATIDGDASVSARELAFVDGVRRGESSLYRFVDGTIARGITGAYATGAVLHDPVARRSEFTLVASERFVIWNRGLRAPLPPGAGGWSWTPLSTAGDDAAAPLAELQNRMRLAEGRTAERLAERSSLVVADGPLNFSLRLDGIVGYVKRHEKAYLPIDLHVRVGDLARGQRTTLFSIGAERFSCYLRLVDRGNGGPWEGVVRLEFPASAGLEAAVVTATALAGLLPAFAGLPHRDPRAPQNLQPIGALERHLRQHLGPEAMAGRAVRDAVAREPLAVAAS